MNRFYVGQRVRVNCPKSREHGEVTAVTSDIRLFTDDVDGTFWAYEVDIPLDPEDNPDFPGEKAAFEPHELIPIDIDGQPATQSFAEIMADARRGTVPNEGELRVEGIMERVFGGAK